MRIVTSKKNCVGQNNLKGVTENHFNEFDINAAAVKDIVRRDIEDGYGILFKPSIEERQELFRLFNSLQEFGIEAVNQLLVYALDSEYYEAMRDKFNKKG